MLTTNNSNNLKLFKSFVSSKKGIKRKTFELTGKSSPLMPSPAKSATTRKRNAFITLTQILHSQKFNGKLSSGLRQRWETCEWRGTYPHPFIGVPNGTAHPALRFRRAACVATLPCQKVHTETHKSHFGTENKKRLHTKLLVTFDFDCKLRRVKRRMLETTKLIPLRISS